MSKYSSFGSSVAKVEPSSADLVKQYRSKFAEQERIYCAIFQQLDQVMGGLFNPTATLEAKNNIVLSSEFLVAGIRSKLLAELSSINTAVAATEHSGLQRVFKERRDVVLQYMQKLSELRGDMDVIQRTRYNDSWKR